MERRIKTQKEPKGPRFTEAPEEVTELAARLIDKHHSQLAEIGGKISYWMVNGNWYSKGNIIEGNCQVVSGLNRKESDIIFRILVNATVWNNSDAKRRSFILDTQLRRCGRKENGAGDPSWYVEEYAVKTFPDIVARYGIMTEEVRQLNAAIHQIELEFDAKMNAANDTDTASGKTTSTIAAA